ncbi:MAG TPA: hypothetical protein DEF01_00205 [Gemmatimonadetes bacterium]|nr:hypothetical protein [Gemmatimonadota bacterium]HBV05128.1 hypothetical protein [Gemmatimonadota bacterium]
MRALNVAFVVQGEGRGHMTQAIALAAMLRDAGHIVTKAMIGNSVHRHTPAYFAESIGAPVIEFEAPVQVPDRNRQGISNTRTLLDAVRRSPRFLKSMATISKQTESVDIVVTFLDLMAGLSRVLFPSKTPALAVAHNYLFLHPNLRGAPGPRQRRSLVLAYAKATTTRVDQKIALSFAPLESIPEREMVVAPPLLRPGLERLETHNSGYLLAYTLNPGNSKTLLDWQRRSGAEVHCFLEGGSSALPGAARGFYAHELDDAAFLKHLAGCRAYVGSAGFEGLCEAHYLGKAALAVPTKGHFEQTLNAWDAERCGTAKAGSYEDLDEFWADPPHPNSEQVLSFKRWVARAPEILVEEVERAATKHGSSLCR